MAEFPPQSLRGIIEEVTGLLKERKETISVAETAAGGIISAAILSTAGASAIYKGGLTLYTLESRVAFGGWTEADIKNYTGPNAKIVAGLADHVRGTLKSTYTVSESGTAGPRVGRAGGRDPPIPTLREGGTDSGYVALAVSSPSGTYTRDVDTKTNDREKNMVLFAEEALKLVRDVIKGDAKL